MGPGSVYLYIAKVCNGFVLVIIQRTILINQRNFVIYICNLIHCEGAYSFKKYLITRCHDYGTVRYGTVPYLLGSCIDTLHALCNILLYIVPYKTAYNGICSRSWHKHNSKLASL